MNESDTTAQKEKAITLQSYTAWLIAFVLTLVPSLMMGAVATILLIVLLIAAYVIRGRMSEGGLAHHHINYIIRTVWIGGLYAVVFTLIASAYMVPNIDYAAFNACAERIVNSGVQSASTEEMAAMAQPCMDEFVAANKGVFWIAMLISALPVLAFFFYRLGKGLMAARRDEEVSGAQSWL